MPKGVFDPNFFRPEEFMPHDWIFDVLSDLHTYAQQNDLPGFAEKVAEAIHEARREVAQTESGGAGPVMFRARARMH
jgi:hypothetical protein